MSGVRRAPLLLLSAMFLTTACGGYPTKPAPGRAEGDPAPSFRLRSAQGQTISLTDFRHKKDVLLYFSMGPG